MNSRAWGSVSIAAVADVVQRRTGLVFSDGRRGIAESAIRDAMKRVGITSPERYAALLDEGGAALDALVADLTVGETYFFRESAQLEFIRNTIVPDLLRHRGASQALRIWSAGCASGEEPYSIAIMLREMELAGRARILGTEISRPRLAAARQARYGRWSMRGVPAEIVARWFTVRDSRYVLDPDIRRMVEFRYLNLAEDTYPASSTGIWGMDLILCRNVLIYFDQETVRGVAARLMSSLAETGWLVLGASDPLLTELVPCEAVVTGAGLAYRRATGGAEERRLRAVARSAAIPPPLTMAERVVEVVAFDESAVAELDAPVESPPIAPTSSVSSDADPAASETAAVSAAYEARDYTTAARLARDALTRHRDSVRPWILLVRSLANVGRLAEAGEACAAALDRHRSSAELVYLHSLLLAESGRVADAAAAARRALYLDRRMIVAHLALGTALSRQRDAEGARRAFANAEELLADLPPAAPVPASDGESAFRLREIVRAQSALLRGDAA